MIILQLYEWITFLRVTGKLAPKPDSSHAMLSLISELCKTESSTSHMGPTGSKYLSREEMLSVVIIGLVVDWRAINPCTVTLDTIKEEEVLTGQVAFTKIWHRKEGVGPPSLLDQTQWTFPETPGCDGRGSCTCCCHQHACDLWTGYYPLRASYAIHVSTLPVWWCLELQHSLADSGLDRLAIDQRKPYHRHWPHPASSSTRPKQQGVLQPYRGTHLEWPYQL